MKKGFTLIELLAVIVILAIIGLITIPLIGNVIEESKKQALEMSVRGIVEATDYFAISNDGVYEFIFDENNKGVTLKGESLDYTGNVDAEGKLYLDREGNISLCLMNDNYYVYKNYNSGILVGNKKDDSCVVGYDVLTNKYVAMLDDGTGQISNVYSKDEVDNLVDNVNTSIVNNTNEITNVKSSISDLQTSLNNYALKSELEETNTNLNNLSSIVSGNTSDIEEIRKTSEYYTLTDIQYKSEEVDNIINNYSLNYPERTWYRFSINFALEYVPFNTGGVFYIEGYKTDHNYEYQIATRYDNNEIIQYARSKYNGVWTDWIRKF